MYISVVVIFKIISAKNIDFDFPCPQVTVHLRNSDHSPQSPPKKVKKKLKISNINKLWYSFVMKKIIYSLKLSKNWCLVILEKEFTWCFSHCYPGFCHSHGAIWNEFCFIWLGWPISYLRWCHVAICVTCWCWNYRWKYFHF